MAKVPRSGSRDPCHLPKDFHPSQKLSTRYYRLTKGSTVYTPTATLNLCAPFPACLPPYVSFNRIYECASFPNSLSNVPPPPSSLLRHGSLPYHLGLCITLRPFSISRYAIDLAQGGLSRACPVENSTNLDRPIFSLSKVGS
jgi:hypothetical protein